MFEQPGERLAVYGSQPLGGLRAEVPCTQNEIEVQLAIGHHAPALDEVGHPVFRRDHPGRRLQRVAEYRPTRSVHPAEVVEADGDSVFFFELARAFISAQVTKRAVPEAFVRHRAQLLLDRADDFVRALRLGQIEAYRVEAREPAHRPGHVRRAARVLPAMALEVQEQAIDAPHLPAREDQRGEKYVLGPRPVRGGQVGQQVLGVSSVEDYVHRDALTRDRLAFVEVGDRALAGDSLPVRPLARGRIA